MNEKSQTGFMHTLKLGKGEGFACETTQSLAQGIVPSFHMGRFTGFFSHGAVMRKDFIISALMCTGKSGHEILLNGESKHGKKTL